MSNGDVRKAVTSDIRTLGDRLLAPSTTPTYIFSRAAVQQVSGPRDYISLFNPVGSGISTIAAAVFLSSVHTATGSTVEDPIRGFRISAVSGGTLVAAADVAKFNTDFADPGAEVRSDPTSSTRQAAFFNSPVAVANRSTSIHDINPPPGAPPFALKEGEGIVIRSEDGSTSTFVNLSLVWAELTS